MTTEPRPRHGATLRTRVHPLAATAFVLLFLTQPALAQGPLPGAAPESDLVDRVVAVAGDSAILATQVQEELLKLQQQGAQMPAPGTAEFEVLEREMVDNLVNQALIVQAALRDSTITVVEDRLDDIVAQDYDRRVQQMGGPDAFRQALEAQGLTPNSFRELLRADARRQQLQSQWLAKHQRSVRVVPVEDAEVREFFETQRHLLGQRPATVTFRQVVLEPQPSEEAVAVAEAEAQAVLDRALEGEDFAQLARRLSEDPGSRQLGGDLGWFRRGSGFVKEFEDAAFSLRDGQMSGLVRTQFGYHIIKVERTRGAERKARHILVQFEIGPEDVERTRQQAEALLDQVRGGASMKALAAEHGAAGTPDSMSVPVDRLGSLPGGYAQALGNAGDGDLLGPLSFGPADRSNFAIVQVVEVRDEGDYTFQDLEQQIRDRLRQEKVLDRLIQDVRERSYVDIRR